MTILITGAAGFIGSHLSLKMLSQNINVIGIDNLNDYYSVILKKSRLKKLKKFKKFTFIKADLSKNFNLERLLKKKKIQVICHLAAQAGVRYSITNPSIYLKYNIDGFLNILEYCRKNKEDFAPFIEDGFEKFIANLETDGEFAGNEAIVALAKELFIY